MVEITHQLIGFIDSRHSKCRAIVTDANLQMLRRTVPKIIRRSEEAGQSGDHLATQRRFRFRALHGRHVEIDRGRVYYGDRVGLAEIHRRLVFEEGQTRPPIHLPALLDLGDLRAFRTPPAWYL